VTPSAPAPCLPLGAGDENSIFVNAPKPRRLSRVRLQLRSGYLLEPETTRRLVPVRLPAVPIAARTSLPGGPKLALHVQRPYLRRAIVTLARSQFVDFLGTDVAVPVWPEPVAPRAAWRCLILGVKSAFEIDTPKLCAAVATLLRGGELGQASGIW